MERLPVKQAILTEAAAVASPTALLATNTSQLSITAIGSALPDASDRVVGMHFFNPAVLMRLVEIVAGLETSDATIATAKTFAESLGKETVVCRKDSPGFLTSRIAAIVRLECMRMLEEGVGTAEDIDRALRLGLNFPIGPLELGDRNGHDTFLLALESMAEHAWRAVSSDRRPAKPGRRRAARTQVRPGNLPLRRAWRDRPLAVIRRRCPR